MGNSIASIGKGLQLRHLSISIIMNSLLQLAGLIATLAFGKATDLDIDTIATFLKKNDAALVKFYAPWCGHCKAMAPAYDEAADLLEGKVALGKIDVTEEANKPASTEYGVQGFPTLKFFLKGKAMDYTGGREAKEIVTWVTSMTGPAVVHYDSRETALAANPKTLIAAYSGAQDTNNKEYKRFLEAAEDNRGKVTFVSYGSSTSLEMIRSDGSTLPIPKIKKSGDIMDFINKEKIGAFIPIGPGNAQDYFALEKLGISLVYFGGEAEEYEKVRETMEIIAEEFKDTYKFTFFNTTEFSKQDEGMMKISTFPSMVTHGDADVAGSYRLTDVDFTKPSVVRKWLKNIVAGDIEPELQSEEIPEENDEPVKIIVGKNFKDIVNDKDDVFIKFYAPWCGHCKTLAPIFEEVGETMAKLSPKTVIAKMDATANEIPSKAFEVKGFPSIYFKPAGKEPMVYTGERTVEGIIEFIREEGTNKVAADKDEL